MIQLTNSLKRKHIIIMIMSVILVVAGVVINPFSYIAFVVLAGIIILSRDTSFEIALLFFLMPFATVFKKSVSSTSFYTYLELLFILKQLFFHRKINKKFFVSWLLFSAYVVVGMRLAFTDAIKQICIPILFYICLSDDNRKEIALYIEMYAVGVFGSSMLGVFKRFIPNLSRFVNLKIDHLGNGVYIDRFAGLWGDPNYYSINLMLVFCSFLYLYTKRKISLVRTLIYFFLVILFGAMTNSKSFIIVLAFTAVFMIVILFQNKHWLLGVVSIIAITVGIYLLFSGKIGIFESSINRLQMTVSQGDMTTGRIDKWNEYFQLFFDHPFKLLFGNGVGRGFSFTVPHNTYIDFIDIYGVVGTFLFVYSLMCAFKLYKINRNFVNILPLLVILVMYFALSMIFYLDFVFQITISFMILFDKQNDKSDSKIVNREYLYV